MFLPYHSFLMVLLGRTDLLLHHLLQLGPVLRVAHHPLKGLRIPHTFWQVWIQQLLHGWVLHTNFSRSSKQITAGLHSEVTGTCTKAKLFAELFTKLFAKLFTCGLLALWFADNLHHLGHLSRGWLQLRNPEHIHIAGPHMSSQKAQAKRTQVTQQQFSLTLIAQHCLA